MKKTSTTVSTTIMELKLRLATVMALSKSPKSNLMALKSKRRLSKHTMDLFGKSLGHTLSLNP